MALGQPRLNETTRLNETKTDKAVCRNVTLVTKGRELDASFCRTNLF
jgi:hypothetical protein